tara:strand:+ start:148 stop:420 length:273 start_codon:yes stop_codon:yes gene_type:complete
MNNTKKVNQVLNYKSFPHLTFAQVYEAGRFGDLSYDPAPLDNVIEELFPTSSIETLLDNKDLRDSVIAHLTDSHVSEGERVLWSDWQEKA